MNFKFEITPPNFAITEGGQKFSLAELPTEDFLDYCHQFRKALADNRERQKQIKNEN